MTDRSLFARLVGGPEGFRRLLERRGPIFIRLGQLLALRTDIMPQEYSDELLYLSSNVAPCPWNELKENLARELGDLPAIFESINPNPLAARPLTQVHQAVTRDGLNVAVKILRPQIRERVQEDVGQARFLARLIPWNHSKLNISPSELVAELTSLLERELDLTHERANIQRLTALAGEDSRIRFPRVHSELSTARVLTTEYLGGIPLADIFSPARRMDLALEDSGFDADELAGNLMQSTLRQMFEYHFYNADPHPRNLLFAPGNAIGYAEFGLCEKLDQSTAREVARFLGEIHRPDLPQMFRVLLALAVPADGADVEKLKVEFMAESHRWLGNLPPVLAAHRSSDSRPPTARWMVGIMQALRRNEFRLPREILASFQTLVTAETLAYRLAPSVHLRTVGREFFTDLQLAETFRFIDPAVQQNLIVKLLIALRDAPEHLNEILSELAEGRFTINLSATEYPPSAKARDQRARLIAAAVVSVAIAYLLAEGGLPAIGRVHASIILGIMLGLLYIYIFVQWRRLQ